MADMTPSSRLDPARPRLLPGRAPLMSSRSDRMQGGCTPRERALLATWWILIVILTLIAGVYMLAALPHEPSAWALALGVTGLASVLTYLAFMRALGSLRGLASGHTEVQDRQQVGAITPPRVGDRPDTPPGTPGQLLARRIMEVHERECRECARQLHDEAGEIIVSLLCTVQQLEDDAADPDAVRAGTVEMAEALRLLYGDLRNMAVSLRPPGLDRMGLTMALRQLVENTGAKHALLTQFRALHLAARFPPEVEVALYRIVQEALHNVVRHAHASRVAVLMQQRDEHLVLIVEDDGGGFDPEQMPPGAHLGLQGMRERVEMLGGTLSIESGIGKGTTVIVAVPAPAGTGPSPACDEVASVREDSAG